MPNPNDKFRDLDPTVIPAPLGYRVAYLGLDDGGEITDQTDPDALTISYDPIVAWVVHPTLRTGVDYTEVSQVGVYPVTPNGMPGDQLWYLVTPDNSWSVQNSEAVGGHWEARRHFIASTTRSEGRG